MSRTLTVVTGVLVLALLAVVSPAAAQPSNFGVTADNERPQAPGWTFTPALAYSTSWDDNVLIRGQGDNTTGDYTNVVNPRAAMSYLGRKTRVDAIYDGAFLMYRQFDTLNSYDQNAALFARHMFTKRIAVFANETLAMIPTTESVKFVGVPFVRAGSTIEDARTGLEVALAKNTTMSVSYNYEWIRFNQDTDRFTQLMGGHSHGGTLTLRHGVGPRTTLFGDYDLQRATVLGGFDTFNVQNTEVGVEQKLSPLFSAFGAIGVSRLGVSSFGPARTGPAWRAGLSRQYRRTGVDVSYSRSFVPSYGFGGTMQNEEITGRFRVAVSRRISAQSSMSWRSNQPLNDDLNLHSRWIEGTISYACQPWLHLEGFYAGSNQTIDRPGGIVDRNRIGVQIVTSNPVRIH